MKYKILTLLILPHLLPMPPLSAQKPEESKTERRKDYAIESERLYPGWLVEEILAAAESEIDKAVEEAYAEGYKAAAARYLPDALYWKTIAEASRPQRTSGFTQNLFFGLCGFALGGIGMGIYTFARH